MAILMSVGGNSAGDGFLIAPLGTTYETEISLSTDAGIANVTLQASPNPAGLVFSTLGPIALSTVPTIVTVHATLQSTSRGDTTIQVLPSGGGAPLASFSITSIKHPVVNFKGRFEARFATDGAVYSTNPLYTAVLDNVVPPGWTWGLEGEPNFVPAVGNVPQNLETTGVGRVVRLNNPVALRSHADLVVSTVDSITGETSSGFETFLAGDPLIGQPVDFGPDTYLAGNQPNGAPLPEERWSAAQEPMALFEIHLGNPSVYFRGASQVGPFTHTATMVNENTRTPDSRPIAMGLASAAAEIAEFGLPNLIAFSDARIDLLVADYDALPAGPSTQRRNLARRIGHLLSSVSAAKASAVQSAHPGVFTVRVGTLPQGWPNKEVYNGKVDTNLHALPGGSSVIAYMTEFFSFDFQWNPFSFHSDELCGHHKGTLSANLAMHGGHIGDPHTRTVDGTSYDFQSVGEFTLLRDGAKMEIQVRQTPVATANPAQDSHTGLTACVSINTAVAARVGRHRISLQPGREGHLLQFYLDGKPANLPVEGIDLVGGRVSAFDANGETGLRVDYDNGTILLATPAFWSAHNVWYINVSVSNTRGDEGIMGFIPKGSWLPRLRNGATVGAMPASLHDRYVALYKIFADSWRVTNRTSLFVYARGTSTKTFTDRDWPAEKPPCKLKREFQLPGVRVHRGMPVAEAEMICRAVTMKDLHQNCVFDVATTGDETFAKGYLLAQELRLYGTAVQIVGFQAPSREDRSLDATPVEPPSQTDHSVAVIATVVALSSGRPIPTGSVTFFVDGVPMKRPVQLDGRGRARLTVGPLKPGEHRIRASYSGGGKYDYHSSTSPNLIYTVTVTPRADDKYKRAHRVGAKGSRARIAPRATKSPKRLSPRPRSKGRRKRA
jgi:Bacterial Ig-like domain (group 3)